MARTVSAVTTYNEALKQLKIAAEALDQAHSMLRDINLNHLGTGSGAYFVSIANMAQRAEQLVVNLQEEVCEECGNTLAENVACLEGRCHLVEEPIRG